MSAMGTVNLSTCLREGQELQNGGLHVRLGRIDSRNLSVEATILAPEQYFKDMNEVDSMIFKKDPFSHDKWVSEHSYPHKGSDREDRVVIRSNFATPYMLYVPSHSPDFNHLRT